MTTTVERAFVIADLAGYTALTEAHGGAEAARTVARYVQLASDALAPGARLVERVGDQVLIVAEDPRSAATTGLRLRDAVDCEPLFPAVRIGIDVGAAVEQDGRYFGSALNIAARMAAHARAGQVLCTERIASAVADTSSVHCVPLGTVRFKNVAEPVMVFELVSTVQSTAVLDPVCRMRLEAATAPARLPVNRMTYYFCSRECAEAFAKHPAAYVDL